MCKSCYHHLRVHKELRHKQGRAQPHSLPARCTLDFRFALGSSALLALAGCCLHTRVHLGHHSAVPRVSAKAPPPSCNKSVCTWRRPCKWRATPAGMTPACTTAADVCAHKCVCKTVHTQGVRVRPQACTHDACKGQRAPQCCTQKCKARVVQRCTRSVCGRFAPTCVHR